MAITTKNIGFIGTGNMARAIIDGVLDKGAIAKVRIGASDVHTKALEQYGEQTGIQVFASNPELAQWADIIVLSVKPNVLEIPLREIRDFAKGKLILSIVAGASIEKIRSLLGEECRIVRTMPNTPAMVSEGMTILSYDGSVTEEDKACAESLFQYVGRIQVLSQQDMNAVIGLTSSSPAYFFVMLEAMADAAVLAGLPRQVSYEMAAQAMLGSAKMLLETGKHPGELKDMVCSPGGTTIEAVAALEEKGFRGAVIHAMETCWKKAERL